MFTIEFGVAKTNKYASRESGDSVEIVERPGGGFSAVLVDGQGSGRAAKTLGQLVLTQAVTLLKQGARDGVVARAANDHLYAYRHGQVSATLNILSVETTGRKIVITRNTHCPVVIWTPKGLTLVDTAQPPLGLYPHTRPAIVDIPLAAPIYVVAVSDGVIDAGRRYDREGKLGEDLENILAKGAGDKAGILAQKLLSLALERDKRRLEDDMSVVVLATTERGEEDVLIRTMNVEVPYA